MSSIFYQVFVRDNATCVYCSKNMMSSFDSFAQVQLDHLKPKKHGGRDGVDNMVVSCSVCNNLKGSFDPTPEEELNSSNREEYIIKAKQFISEKRCGNRSNGLFSDYSYWLKEFNSPKS